MQAIPHPAEGATRPPVPLGSLSAPQRPPRIRTPFARDVLAGLSRPQKSIPCTWLYDRRGCELFEEITHLDEYYPTRTEVQILQQCARQIAAEVGPGATLVELGSGSSRKTPLLRSLLIPAYDDREGVTAAFNKNLLTRINRELEGDFDPKAFKHEARFNDQRRCVEMHLVSRTRETFEVLGRRFSFAAGESIHTESSYKYSLNRFQDLAQRAGWESVHFWTDSHARFGVHLLQRHS